MPDTASNISRRSQTESAAQLTGPLQAMACQTMAVGEPASPVSEDLRQQIVRENQRAQTVSARALDQAIAWLKTAKRRK
jgi:cytochrome c-type biogenesis protein CcmH/NrfF